MNFFTSYHDELILCARLLATIVSAGLLGWERSRRYKAAGIRVFMIVSFASSLLSVISLEITQITGTGDPGRIAAAIVGGVSFICIAIIYRQGSTLRGLTTAAGLWTSAAIGIGFGFGMYFVSVFATLVVLLVQIVLHLLYVDNDSMSIRDVSIRMVKSEGIKDKIVKNIEAKGAEVSGRSLRTNADGTVTYTFAIKPKVKIHFEDIAGLMEEFPEEILDVVMS